MTILDDHVMQSWLEVRLPSGRTVMLRSMGHDVSPRDEEKGGVEDVGFRSIDFRTITATLHEIGQLIADAVRPLAPHEAEVELGVGLKAGTGQLLVLFGEAAAEATMKVNLRWRFGAEAGS